MLYERYARRRVQEGREEGRNLGVLEGREAERNEWMAWLKRRDEALAAGEEFDEPPPSAKASTNGQ